MIFITSETDIQLKQSLSGLYFYYPNMMFQDYFLNFFQQAEKDHPEIKFLAVDALDFPSQCKRFSVVSVPTLIFFRNGKELGRKSNIFHQTDYFTLIDDIYQMIPKKERPNYEHQK